LNLFDANLPILHAVTIGPDTRALLLDLHAIERGSPRVVAAACRITDQHGGPRQLRFRAEGIAGTQAVIRISVPAPPSAVLVDQKPWETAQYEYEGGSVRMRFENSVEGHSVEVRF
jgi:hypothetical protein